MTRTEIVEPPAPAPLIVDGRPGPRFVARHDPPTSDGNAGADLDGDALRRLVDAVGAHRQTGNRTVAASLWMSQYASWTVAPVLTELAAGRLLSAPLDAVTVHSTGGVIDAVRFARPSSPMSGDPDRDEEALVVDLVDRNLALMVDRLRGQVRVSSRTLWGSVAAAFATGVRVLSWCAGPADPLHDADAAAALVGRLWARRGLDRHCRVDQVVERERSWLVVHRGACCLAYQTPTGRYCATCSLSTPDDRTARLRETVHDHLRETG